MKVKDTHILMLIPKTVDGNPFTLTLLFELINTALPDSNLGFKSIPDDVLAAFGDKPVKESHWVLMPKYMIPDSEDKSYEEQKELAEAVKGYEVLSLLEAATAILLDQLRTGQLFYDENVYIRCREMMGGHPLAIGGATDENGLTMHNFRDFKDPQLGISAIRKFPEYWYKIKV